MKRLLIFLVSLFASLVFASAQTDLYQRYASQPDIKVASVTGFALDSASQVDVTVIAAEDDAGWDWMKREFGISDLTATQQDGLRDGADVVLFARRSRANPRDNAPLIGEEVDMAASCYMGVSYLARAVYVFCADTEEQYDAVVTRLVKKIMHQSR